MLKGAALSLPETAVGRARLEREAGADVELMLADQEAEGVLDTMQARLDQLPDAMGVRRQTVEHPFGTLKWWMGSTHFLTRTIERVRTEMSPPRSRLQYETGDQDPGRRAIRA